jgi:hypothetical protein
MNLNIVEKITREVRKSNLVATSTRPIEHKSINSLSMQIATNLRPGNTVQLASPATSIWF